MKKAFGIFLIIIGVISMVKVFSYDIYGAIGGIIGISLVSFLPAYFLLRSKKDEEKRY